MPVFPPACTLSQTQGIEITEATPVLKEPQSQWGDGDCRVARTGGSGAGTQSSQRPSGAVTEPPSCGLSVVTQFSSGSARAHTCVHTDSAPGALGPCTRFHSNYAWMPPKPAAGALSPSPEVAASTHCGSGAAPSLRSRPARCRAGAPPP